MPFSSVLDLYLAALGLIVGSYLNVVIYRLPRGSSTVLPRSRCPCCGHLILARDNIPVLSFLLLRGRCRHCQASISWRYPMVEAATALLFVASVHRFGLGMEAAAGALFGCGMIVLAAIDLEHFILPDRITLPGIVIGLALQPWLSWTSLFSALLGTLLGAGVLLAMAGLWYLIRRQEGMGMGDVKMLAMIGAFLGVRGVLITLFFGALSGAGVGVGLILGGRLDMKSKLPFGTFLALGGLIALFAGDRMLESYLRLL